MKILAATVGVENVYLDPHELKQSRADLPKLAAFLGTLLDKDPQWILEQSRDTRLRYKQVAGGIEGEVADEIRAYIAREEISGVHLEPSSRRSYPYGSLASQVIGFTNISGQGCEGVEAAYDSFLSGGPGKVVTTRGNNEMDMPYS